MKQCAIVILNWNGRQFLERYLPTLIEKTPSELAQIYIIDNDSTDDSIHFLREYYGQIPIVQNSKNLGFAGGYNHGLSDIYEPILCLLNSDIEVTENWIEPILAYFYTNLKLAALQPKILDLKDNSKFEYAGGSGGYYDRMGYAVCRGRYFDHVEEDHGQYDDIVDICWASGCCLFIRNQIFRQVGGFDEDYFAHQEEIDLCWRIHNLGFEIKSFPKSIVYHYGGGSLPYGSYFKSYLNFRNSLFNLFKNLTKKQLLIIFPLRILFDWVAVIHAFVKTSGFLTSKSILHAHYSFLFSIPLLIEKRKKIANKGFPNCVIKKHILIDYYLFNCRLFSDLMKK